MTKALLIEDDADTRQIYRLLLQHAGWSVVDAPSGEIGLQLMASHRPQLVLLDLGLPKLSGLEIIEDLLRLHKAPIIVVSGSEESAAEAVRLGAADFLLKPFDPFDELMPMIERVVGAANSP
jgi:DNA-binding response OmpR family regulator